MRSIVYAVPPPITAKMNAELGICFIYFLNLFLTPF
jgi:hypothetical protein